MVFTVLDILLNIFFIERFLLQNVRLLIVVWSVGHMPIFWACCAVGSGADCRGWLIAWVNAC